LFGEQLVERKSRVYSHSIVAGGLLTSIIEGCSLAGILSITLSWIFTDIRHVEKMEEEMI
jgi:hypothetical protein